jgi:sorting and assembly machinery component 37
MQDIASVPSIQLSTSKSNSACHYCSRAMVLELHIWGPGFGLPSIDPHCLATIAVCAELLPPTSWTLVAANSPLSTPVGELPALRDDLEWVGGFRNIVQYLDNKSTVQKSIHSHLNDSQLADCTAFLSFVESRGLPLLDLLLYVSSENYHACTRPALGNILSWPESWVIPGRLREKAKKRSEHLGLSSLDVDTAEEDKSKGEGLTAQIPASLRRPKYTVTSILGRDMKRNRFRLDAVNSDFLDPLQEALGNRSWLFGDAPSAADCLVAAVLSLMYFPPTLAHPWLKDVLDRKYSNLAAWTRRTAAAWFDIRALASSSNLEKATEPQLPWSPAPARDWLQTLNVPLVLFAESTPVVGSYVVQKEIETSNQSIHTTGHNQRQVALTRKRQEELVYSQVWTSFVVAMGLTGVLLWNGTLRFPWTRGPGPRVRNFGAAGSILGIG